MLDEAAVLLAVGATSLRILKQRPVDPAELQSAKEWVRQIFPIGQRLQLWLPHDDPLVKAYDKVRQQLVAVSSTTGQASDEQIDTFEKDRTAFLDLARAKLLEPILASEGAE